MEFLDAIQRIYGFSLENLSEDFSSSKSIAEERQYSFLEKEKELFEDKGFSLYQSSNGPWTILTPSLRELDFEDLSKFYYDTKLEFGNKEHIETLKALEYLSVLYWFYQDIQDSF